MKTKIHDKQHKKERRCKARGVRIVIVEIIFMAANILCVILPMPWRLLVPILIGARGIILKARLQMRRLPPLAEEAPPPKSTAHSKGKTDKEPKKQIKKPAKASAGKRG